MPELPEVQTVLDTLENRIKGAEIIAVKVLYDPIISMNKNTFIKKLKGQHFNEFKRRGKFLLFELDDMTLVSHLRMEGKYFIYDEKQKNINKHTHVIFYLDHNRELHYNDVRKFGRMEIIAKDDNYQDFHDLGVEPFSKEFNLNYCKEYLNKNRRPIKQILLDQSFIAGIGNIYADEIIFEMKIHPKTPGNKLNDDDIKNLIKATNNILKKAIKKGGTTIRSYTSSLGVTGRFQLSLKVHTKDICPICKNKIEKIVVATRGTYYCPKCQKEKK